jgi:uncharacterized protein (DUF433 family)
LRIDRDGAVRIDSTRVTLETLVTAFRQGATAEEIALRYPVLDLADVYGAIAYYSRHRDEVESYLAERKKLAEDWRREAPSLFDTRALREKLLARRGST